MRGFAGSLYARTALTLAFAFIVFQALATWVVVQTLIVPVAERSADDLAGLIVLSAQTWVELPPETRAAFERELARRHGLRLTTVDVGATAPAPYFAFRRQIEDAISQRTGDVVELRGVPGTEAAWLELPVGGHDLRVGFFPQRYAVRPPLAAVAVIGVGTLLSLLTALFLVRRITVPLGRAAQAARQVGAGQLPEPLPETGPAELAELARRFNTMATDVRELLDNRTTLLGGISHDLRTPMTRLRLNLELLRDDPAPARIDRALADLDDMNRLVAAYLDLARASRAEARSRFDLAALLGELAAGAGVPWEAVAACEIEAGPLAVRQLHANLVQNALRYGGGARGTRAGVRRAAGARAYTRRRPRHSRCATGKGLSPLLPGGGFACASNRWHRAWTRHRAAARRGQRLACHAEEPPGRRDRGHARNTSFRLSPDPVYPRCV